MGSGSTFKLPTNFNNMNKQKICSICGRLKNTKDSFHRSKKYQDGFRSKCKKCVNIYWNNYYQLHKKDIQDRCRDHYQLTK